MTYVLGSLKKCDSVVEQGSHNEKVVGQIPVFFLSNADSSLGKAHYPKLPTAQHISAKMSVHFLVRMRMWHKCKTLLMASM